MSRGTDRTTHGPRIDPVRRTALPAMARRRGTRIGTVAVADMTAGFASEFRSRRDTEPKHPPTTVGGSFVYKW